MNLTVSHRRPTGAAIRCLPQTATHRTEIIFQRALDYARGSYRTPTAIRTDVAPTHRVEKAGVIAVESSLGVPSRHRQQRVTAELLLGQDCGAESDRGNDGQDFDDFTKTVSQTCAHGDTSLRLSLVIYSQADYCAALYPKTRHPIN